MLLRLPTEERSSMPPLLEDFAQHHFAPSVGSSWCQRRDSAGRVIQVLSKRLSSPNVLRKEEEKGKRDAPVIAAWWARHDGGRQHWQRAPGGLLGGLGQAPFPSQTACQPPRPPAWEIGHACMGVMCVHAWEGTTCMGLTCMRRGHACLCGVCVMHAASASELDPMLGRRL